MELSQNNVHRSLFHVVHHTEKDSYTWLFLDSALNEDTSQEKRSFIMCIH